MFVLLRRRVDGVIWEMSRKRKAIKAETIAARKERRFAMTQNLYSLENTGERGLKWCDSKRLRQLGLMYNKGRNTHRFSFKMSETDCLNLKEKSEKYAQYQYWLGMAERAEHGHFHRIQTELNADLDTLPFHLRQDCLKKHSRATIQSLFPPQHNITLLYWEQLLRLYPTEKANAQLLTMQLCQDIVLQRK